MTEEKAGLEIDDWLDDLADDKPDTPAAEASGEMDQSDIDALLGGGEAASEPSSAEDDGGGELDQSDIDALLGGGSAAPVSADGGGGEGFAELDQSDIDSLLGGGEGPAKENGPALASDDNFDLDQSDIDGLFNSAGEEKDSPETSLTEGLDAPSKDDVDQLFSNMGADEPDHTETVSFAEVAQEESEKAGLPPGRR